MMMSYSDDGMIGSTPVFFGSVWAGSSMKYRSASKNAVLTSDLVNLVASRISFPALTASAA